MTRDKVYELCKSIGPMFGFEPILILALCEQESVNPKNAKEYREWIARPETNFYFKYVESEYDLATTTEVLFSNSFGLTQMMGLSLRLAGFFEWHFAAQTKEYQDFYNNDLLNEIAVVKAINQYMDHPEWQVEWGCRWLKHKQEEGDGTLDDALRRYNGSKLYPPKVHTRERKLRKVYGV